MLCWIWKICSPSRARCSKTGSGSSTSSLRNTMCQRSKTCRNSKATRIIQHPFQITGKCGRSLNWISRCPMEIKCSWCPARTNSQPARPSFPAGPMPVLIINSSCRLTICHRRRFQLIHNKRPTRCTWSTTVIGSQLSFWDWSSVQPFSSIISSIS